MRTNKRVRAIIIRNNKLLLDHRYKDGKEWWVVIGGGVEEGETTEEALRREINEETGLELLQFSYVDTATENECEQMFFECKVSEGEAVMGGPEMEEDTEENKHVLEWVEVKKVIEEIENIYPKAVLDFLR